MSSRGSGPRGGVQRSLKLEVGAPLILVGALIALLTVDVRGAGISFWVGVLMVGSGLSLMISR